jgi:hypothetical protein
VSGNLLQTFYLMFKTNATQAKKDLGDMGKASEDAEKKLKKTREETGELGKAFTSTFENGLRALAAYGSFQAMKAGIVNAQQFNRELTIQTKLWGQNANEINAWGSAVKAAGGNTQSFFGWYDNIRKQQASRGQAAMPLTDLMRHIRSQVKGQDSKIAQMYFGQYGLEDPGAQSILQFGTDEQFEKMLAAHKELTKNTEAGSEAAQQFGTSWDNLSSSLGKFWTTVNTVILPPLAKFLDGLTEFFNLMANDKEAAVGTFAALTVVMLAFTAAIPAMVAGFGAISAAALSALVPIAAMAAALTSIVAHKQIAGVIDSAGWNPFSSAEDYEMERRAKARYQGMSGGSSGAGGSKSAMDYLMNKHGLSATHAAGIVANMQAESSGDINARGDGGRAHGLFQWHPDRQALIKSGTGIDVSNATKEQQLDAMMWELKQRGELGGFLSQTTASGAGSYFSQKFERPAGGMMEAMKRGQMAMEIAGSTPFASQSGAAGSGPAGGVSIGKIDVNTAATDADGIARDINSALQKHIGGVFSQNNDAVAY